MTFVVGSEDMGLAIGKKGSNIKHAEKVFGKEISVVEYSDDPVKFIKNSMYPIRPKTINIEGNDSKKVAKVLVHRKDRAVAIGAKGKNIHKVKKIVTRHHDIADVTIV